MTSVSDAPAVRTEELYKFYGTTEAVSGLDLVVPAGITFGFLGPNGAGKTTTIGMLCTLLLPTSGRAEVSGYDVVAQPHEVRDRIGLVFQESTLDLDLTAEENMRFHAELFGLSRRQSKPAVDALLDLVELTDRKDSPVRDYSGGMRRRLEIARGLLNTPSVLFLDEPTTGLDPQTRVAIWEHLHRLRRDSNVTLFLTTHHLEEAENCDRIAIMDHGDVVAHGTPAELKAVVGADLVVLRTGDDHAAVRAAREGFGLDGEIGADGVRLRVDDGATFVPRLCAGLGVAVHSVTVKPPSLDDVFLHYTGRSIRDDAGPTTLADIGRRSA
ncbi:ABC-2 type transport system ATP-binding protein [Herbihabitans rhizosphaerae]|uniref:ABC-2 type transport system ATP-binding protein n=1 Tax=Herbihabitans rhizosphaerae TaxID=1872711 RepID=A0A4Q7KGJ4_9PSEU|nr:ATP-binding cassette domain-containing protein [Herbihabitans rhizosphaerae]RZS33981.1 ABC-2 type transport system ATP-binding protein [Herbihabitans rhizosphaerae]